jgi:LPXTG-site transpeptidase (sortase) family protein
VIYNADFGQAGGGHALGHFLIDPEEFITPPTPGPSNLPATGFPRGVVRKSLNENGQSANSDLILSIPKLGLKTPIIGVPLQNGNWDVSWLGNNAGYLYGTAFPTWQGNTAITGHVWGTDNQPGPFHQLKTLHFGDQVQIYAWGMIYTYEVRENQIVFPSRVNNVLQHEEYDWVTLLTCEFYNPFSGEYFFRRVVRAVLVDISPQ